MKQISIPQVSKKYNSLAVFCGNIPWQKYLLAAAFIPSQSIITTSLVGALWASSVFQWLQAHESYLINIPGDSDCLPRQPTGVGLILLTGSSRVIYPILDLSLTCADSRALWVRGVHIFSILGSSAEISNKGANQCQL